MTRRQSVGSQALTMKNQLRHTIATGKQKNPGFFGPLEAALQKLIEDEREKRIEQAEFLKQLELFTRQIREKASGAQQAGFESPAQVAVYDYLNVQFDQQNEASAQHFVKQSPAKQWTAALFNDDDIGAVLASPIWKDKKEIHKELQKQIRKKLRALAG